MINFDRNRFNEMSTNEKEIFVNYLVDMSQKLNLEELSYLTDSNRKKYFYDRIRTSEWLDDYEFDELTDKEKEFYITNRRYLNLDTLSKISTELQKNYITKAISSGIQLKPEEFNVLPDDLKCYYVNEKIRYAGDITFTPEELDYLDEDGQTLYIKTLKSMGLAPNSEDFKYLKPKAIRINLSEIRKIVREEIKKVI